MIWEKINITSIITDHLKTLSDFDPEASEQKISRSDILIFFVTPLLLSALLLYLDIYLHENIVNILIASLSIFVGLLLNLLVILMGLLDKSKEKISRLKSLRNDERNENEIFRVGKKIRLLKETYSNISFSVLVAFISIPIFLTALLKNIYIQFVANLIAYFLLILFALTMFMVLKRVHLLLATDGED